MNKQAAYNELTKEARGWYQWFMDNLQPGARQTRQSAAARTGAAAAGQYQQPLGSGVGGSASGAGDTVPLDMASSDEYQRRMKAFRAQQAKLKQNLPSTSMWSYLPGSVGSSLASVFGLDTRGAQKQNPQGPKTHGNQRNKAFNLQ